MRARVHSPESRCCEISDLLTKGHSRAVIDTIVSTLLLPHPSPWDFAVLTYCQEVISPAPWLCAQPCDLLWPIRCQQMQCNRSRKAFGSLHPLSLASLPLPWEDCTQAALLSQEEDERGRRHLTDLATPNLDQPIVSWYLDTRKQTQLRPAQALSQNYRPAG